MNLNKESIRGGVEESESLFIAANTAWDAGDLEQAFSLLFRSAVLGNVSSQLDLGYFFDQGLSVKVDKRKALEWYHRAYKQGEAGAANNIATIYREWGDSKKMLWWFRRAASMGHLDVALELGKRYETGLDVPRSRKKAEEYYRRVLLSPLANEDDKARASDRLAGLGK
jgi:TPR repeat protein